MATDLCETASHIAAPMQAPRQAPRQAPNATAAQPVYSTRLARGAYSEESARTSLSSGESPSTLAVPDSGRERRLAAKERAAAMASSADQLDANAAVHAARCAGGRAASKESDISLRCSSTHHVLSRPASQPASQPAGRPAGRPASQPASSSSAPACVEVS